MFYLSSKVLYVQKPIDVDTLKKTQLDLKVQMTHGYQTSLASVKVSLTDENDNFPVFEQTAMKEISVQEGSLGKTFFLFRFYNNVVFCLWRMLSNCH